ncbi:uncharacterized protein LOC115797249 [Archocentrus centrarchus]|uniref:uncharacterized protein LOC115797249 n=1 Tax=Archocentrus centrarchus TaxID=63155 RepID=UPI0011EA3F3B|nr:uncharacterized protein LOC115797249 [Archocentrus centrarchus]
MIQLLLFFSTMSSVWMFVVKKAPTVYQAEEEGNITIRWDSRIQTDLSRANVMCVSRSDVTKTLYKMIRGVEDSESQHEQFAGRVQIDGDALRGGPIRLHLSRVTAEDSGNYSCYLTADYDDSLKRWRLETSEHFALDVSRTSDGDSSDVSLQPPSWRPPTGLKLAEGRTHREEIGLYVLTAFLFAANAGTIVLSIKFLYDGLKRSATY